ncbi:MAG: response regulator [Verrucomicrobiota bacterium]
MAARLHAVPDGAEALEFIFTDANNVNRQHIQNLRIIILDLKLPKLGGLEVLRRLKSNSQTRKIPVVWYSAHRKNNAT